jgi:manganese/iron transport system ATP-binding protein
MILMTSAVVATDVELAHGEHVALRDVSLDIPTGVSVAVIGPNGSGKSSFLDAVAGLLPVRRGSLAVLGRSPGTWRARLAYVLQSTEIPEQVPLTVREVVTMGRYSRTGLWRRLGVAGRTSVDEAMHRVDVADLARRQVHELSGGQRQRVLVAQGLATDAEMLLLDEPMTGLDVVSRARISGVVAEERAKGRTVLYSTHDLSEAAEADLVVLLAGRLVAAGPPEEVLVERHLRDAYRGRVVPVGGVGILDDPHHHGGRADRHDGHLHTRHDPARHDHRVVDDSTAPGHTVADRTGPPT